MSATPYIWSLSLAMHEVGKNEHSYSFVDGRFNSLAPAFEKEFATVWRESHQQMKKAAKVIWYGVINTVSAIPDVQWGITQFFSLEEALALRRKGLMDLSIMRYHFVSDKEEHGQSYDWDGANK